MDAGVRGHIYEFFFSEWPVVGCQLSVGQVSIMHGAEVPEEGKTVRFTSMAPPREMAAACELSTTGRVKRAPTGLPAVDASPVVGCQHHVRARFELGRSRWVLGRTLCQDFILMLPTQLCQQLVSGLYVTYILRGRDMFALLLIRLGVHLTVWGKMGGGSANCRRMELLRVAP